MFSFLSHLLLLLLICLTSASSTANSTRPHIILIVADDLGYNDVSFHGSDQIPTPNLDFLAYNGVILNNYYVSPICTPTRSALLTGRHPIHTGMQHSVIFGDEPYGLPLNETLMSQHLNELGYRSHIVGKWHLGMFQWDYTPLYRGFESHFGYYQGCEDYYDHTYEANLQWGLDFRRDKELMWNYTGYYSTNLFKDEAVKIINTHDASEPLFLYLPFQAVHSANKDGPNLQAPQELIDKFSYIHNKQRRIYAAMVSALDDAVGVVYDTLNKTGLLSNSVIVFTTDNGGPANGFDFNAANNFPLRGVKATLWEGGVRGVGFVHSPLLKKQGYVLDQMLHVCDWLPTLYRVAGGDPSILKNLDGFDAWKMISENGNAIRSEILHNIDPIQNTAAIRMGDYKLLIGNIGGRGWNGWYPPYQLAGDEFTLHVSNYTDDFKEPEVKRQLRFHLQSNYNKWWSDDVYERMKTLQRSHVNQHRILDSSSVNYPLGLRFQSEKELSNNEIRESIGHSRSSFMGSPVKVDCGPKPANASTNCNPVLSVCLYNIRDDPCEYNNVASQYPQLVQDMFARLVDYAATAVVPGNKPSDDAGNPSHHGGAWVPWR